MSDPEIPYKIVYNQRNLEKGLMKKVDEYAIYRKHANWLCQASGIQTITDVKKDADAFIVGEHLVDVCKEYRRNI